MEPITEKQYPVRMIWVYKVLVSNILSGMISLGFFILIVKFDGDIDDRNFQSFIFLAFGGFILLSVVFRLIANVLTVKNFHFSLDEQYLTLRQGIISKQERHIPYGVIQNTLVKQGLMDRLLGLSSLVVENAAQGGIGNAVSTKAFGFTIPERNREQMETVGFGGNKVSIPGLSKQDAEELKKLIWEKVQANPMVDTQSGL